MSETEPETPPSPASDPEGEPDHGRGSDPERATGQELAPDRARASTDTRSPSRASARTGRASRGEIVAALLGTVAADAFVFRAAGYAGLAAMFAAFPLFGLLDHEDRIIHDGVRAKLAMRQSEIERFSCEAHRSPSVRSLEPSSSAT